MTGASAGSSEPSSAGPTPRNNERPQFIDGRFGVWHAPQAAPRGGLLLAPPLGDEMPPSRRIMADIARALAQSGVGVLRLDYLGTGDSEGEFCNVDWASLADDVRRGVGWLRDHQGGQPVHLLGIRLGGSLILRLGDELAAERRVAISPVIVGEQEVRNLNTRARLRRAATVEEGGTSKHAPNDELDVVDIDGLAWNPRLLDQLGDMDLRTLAAPQGDTLILQVGPRKRLTPELAALGEHAGSRVTAECLYHPPFWNRIDYERPATMIQRLLDFI
jgi:alpha/beta superfamily hydrolase